MRAEGEIRSDMTGMEGMCRVCIDRRNAATCCGRNVT